MGISLDAAQQRVTSHRSGSLLVLGGPGTGKTTVLEELFVRLATAEGCSADRILFLVPNRAQKIAVQDRLLRRLLFEEGLDAVVEVPVYTWHGLANHLVGRHYDRLAYAEPPVLLTSPEHWADVREALANEPETSWAHHRELLRNKGFVDEVVDFCIRAEQRLLEPSDLDAIARARPSWVDVLGFFRAHLQRLRSRSRVDYPTLLADAVELIANHDDVRTSLHRRFPHVLVDDGQELALVQQRMLTFLTDTTRPPGGLSEPGSVVVAGDPDSAIETFRGAEPEWLERFGELFDGAESVTLTTSYRLGPDLGRSLSSFLGATGDGAHRPEGFAGRGGLEVRRFSNLAGELEAVARELRLAHLVDGVAYADMAILLTSPGAMLAPLERALSSVEVPFSISAPDRPLQREPAVRAVATLARVAFSPRPPDDTVLELLRSPLVALPDGQVRELERAARLRGVPVAEVVSAPPESIDSDGASRLAELVELRDALLSKQDRPADEAFWVVWTGASWCRVLVERARADLADPANRDLDALVAFARALGRFVERRRGSGTLADYLDAMERADFGSDPWLPPERGGRGVEVLSFHGAKGRQWELVAVCGCVEGAIPKGRRATGLFDPYLLDEPDPVERARKNEREDRRVFYVALTRAAGRCLATTSPGPTRKGRPTPFLDELVDALPEVERHVERPPLTLAEAAGRHRRVLSDVHEGAGRRVAALAALERIWRTDPGCGAADPREWWWRWDWTEGARSIRSQHGGTEDELPPDKLRTSYSRISTYDNCGLQYLYSVVLGLDPDSSHNMAFGSWIHKVFEEVERGAIDDKQGALARFDELFEDSVFPNKPVARQFRRDGEVMIDRYRLLDPGRAVLAETSFKVDLDGNLISGRIDRVDRKGKGLIVSDYKTSRWPVGWDEARRSLQLAIYYLAARSDPRIAELGEPISMQLVYPGQLNQGKVARRCQTPEEAEAALKRLPALIDGVLREDFRPNPEADCTWCRFRPLCPLWAEGKELPA